MITTAMLPGGRGPAWVRRPNAAHRHDHRARVTQARLPRVVQCPPPTRSSRRDSSAKTCSGARGARCRQVVPLAARLDTRVPAGVAAVVRLSGTGLPVAPARGCRHSKMTTSYPSSPVAAGTVKPRRRTGCPARTRARRPGGQHRTREAARWPLTNGARGTFSRRRPSRRPAPRPARRCCPGWRGCRRLGAPGGRPSGGWHHADFPVLHVVGGDARAHRARRDCGAVDGG